MDSAKKSTRQILQALWTGFYEFQLLYFARISSRDLERRPGCIHKKKTFSPLRRSWDATSFAVPTRLHKCDFTFMRITKRIKYHREVEQMLAHRKFGRFFIFFLRWWSFHSKHNYAVHRVSDTGERKRLKITTTSEMVLTVLNNVDFYIIITIYLEY